MDNNPSSLSPLKINEGLSVEKIHCAQHGTFNHPEAFFGIPLPDHINDELKGRHVLAKLDQSQLMKILDLSPPFLKIQRIIVTSNDSRDILQSKSLGVGVITQADTKGHYNELLSLALCGQLMASTAAIHLAALFPKTAPQAIEVNGIKPHLSVLKAGGLWKPSAQGTPFFAESSIVKKKMQLVWVATKISFGKIPYGIIEELKFVLIPGKALSSAAEIPTV